MNEMKDIPIAFKDQEVLRQQIPTGTLTINEIFYSIQGEGKHTGVPMVFVRTNLCRINCNFCDTRYTWEFISHNKFYTPEDLMNEIQRIAPRCKHVCITGGEPMEQVEILYEACKLLTLNGFKVHIETSGSIIIPKNFGEVTYWITCSPKRFNGANFNSPIKEVKILVTKNQNVEKLKSWVRNFRRRIYVSIQPIEPDPLKIGNLEGLSSEQIANRELALVVHETAVSLEWQNNVKNAMEICKATGWALSIQIHKYLRIR